MKKIFSRGSKPGFSAGNSNSNNEQGSSSSSSSGLSGPNPGGTSSLSHSFSGSTWTVGRHTANFEDVIAEGGFGMVFLVKVKGPVATSSNKKMFALKRMFVNNDKDLAVCKREINIVSNLNGHKNLIGYTDSSITLLDGGVHEVLLLMPYHKTTLLQLMNDRLSTGFTESEVLNIFCDICAAVSRLHHCQTPIIHRDLKVENVLQSEEGGHYILCDFGSATAKVLNPGTQGITQVEEEIKRYTTLSYRAPEMVDLYNELPLTSKTDIWALGCMLYKTCYFTLPFGESSLAIQAGNVSFPANSKYSTDLKKLIVYLLTVDVDSRPDIFQASHLACQLAKRKCNVQNLHNVPVPSFDALSETPTKPASKEPSSSSQRQIAPQNTVEGDAPSTAAAAAVAAATTPGAALFAKTAATGDDASAKQAPVAGETNTSIAPRQRPRGAGLVPAKGTPILPLPSPSKGGVVASSKNPFTGGAPSKPVVGHNTTSNNQAGYNPFSSGFAQGSTPSSQQPQSLPANAHSASNPFRSAATTADPSAAPTAATKPAGKSNWNPFEDSKKFGELSEDALFGEQFDQIRNSDQDQGQGQRADPFVSAPFTS